MRRHQQAASARLHHCPRAGKIGGHHRQGQRASFDQWTGKVRLQRRKHHQISGRVLRFWIRRKGLELHLLAQIGPLQKIQRLIERHLAAPRQQEPFQDRLVGPGRIHPQADTAKWHAAVAQKRQRRQQHLDSLDAVEAARKEDRGDTVAGIDRRRSLPGLQIDVVVDHVRRAAGCQ